MVGIPPVGVLISGARDRIHSCSVNMYTGVPQDSMLRPVLFSPYIYLYIASPSTGMLMTLSSSFLSLLEKDSSFFYPSRTLVSNPGPGEPARFSVVPVLTHLIQLISAPFLG